MTTNPQGGCLFVIGSVTTAHPIGRCGFGRVAGNRRCRGITLCRLSSDDVIELTQQQFRQYVKDDWGWKEVWAASNTAYLEA